MLIHTKFCTLFLMVAKYMLLKKKYLLKGYEISNIAINLFHSGIKLFS